MALACPSSTTSTRDVALIGYGFASFAFGFMVWGVMSFVARWYWKKPVTGSMSIVMHAFFGSAWIIAIVLSSIAAGCLPTQLIWGGNPAVDTHNGPDIYNVVIMSFIFEGVMGATYLVSLFFAMREWCGAKFKLWFSEAKREMSNRSKGKDGGI